ncbi:hypothetical protein DFJ77DRAFT_544700 [Powellomyces hirtus]|nr:hypothetical protein DFJ77DRAFT_444293 [Powellomyces hirtus]KAI8903251.1 hypothetical protein DFJ77DRAFT_544700 [Powellomyces hirtus]
MTDQARRADWIPGLRYYLVGFRPRQTTSESIVTIPSSKALKGLFRQSFTHWPITNVATCPVINDDWPYYTSSAFYYPQNKDEKFIPKTQACCLQKDLAFLMMLLP